MKHGVYATFMPKPIFGQNGSGMHTHQSLFKGKKNAFFDDKDQYCLSEGGKSYIASLLKHAPEFCSIIAQWVNSYKRLVPGYEAPVYVVWARRNRSALVRVPMYKPGKEVATRCELRCPDPACNPYLSFAVMLAAGLKGMQEKYVLADPVEEDIFDMPPQELKKHKINALPGSLGEAVELTANSAVVKECLGATSSSSSSRTSASSGTSSASTSPSGRWTVTCPSCDPSLTCPTLAGGGSPPLAS